MSQILKLHQMRECFNPACDNREDTSGVTLKACSRCTANKEAVPAVYCSSTCQAAHWPAHKRTCKTGQPRKPVQQWADKYRLCHDGSSHFGALELITWPGVGVSEYSDDKLGWGGTLLDEVEWLQDKFHNEFEGSKSKLTECFQGAFRWTCCGMSADEGVHGCDHHGVPEAPAPCKCDFCRGGRQLPQSIYDRRRNCQAARSVTIRRGPDPRSANAAGALNFAMREAMGF